MKERKTRAAVALALLALASVVVYFALRSEPHPAVTANAPPAKPFVAPPPAAREAPPAAPAAANTAPAIEAARPADSPTAGVRSTSRADKGARNLGLRDRSMATTAAETAPESAKPDDGVAAEPVASAESPAPKSTAEAHPPPPAPKPALPEPGGSALGRFQNRVGPSFSLVRVSCVVDGQTVYSGPGGKSLQLFQRTLTPGSHSVAVVAEYRANSAGVFSYANGYRFKVSSSRRFSVVSGKPVQIGVTGYEKGGPTDDFGNRLALAINAR